MNALTAILNSRPLPAYFGLTYIGAWAVWLPAAWLELPVPVVFLGALAPTAAAIAVTYFEEGRPGVRALLEPVMEYRVTGRSYLWALLGPLGVVLIGAVLSGIFGGSYPELGELPRRLGLKASDWLMAYALIPVLIAGSFLGGPLAEEVGWRGFAQPRLQRRIGPGLAGLLIGLLWALWHAPLLAYFPAVTGGLPVAYYLPLVTCFGTWFAWLYVRTGGSVLLAICLHAGVNFAFGVNSPVDLSLETGRLPFVLGTAVFATGIALWFLRSRPVQTRRAPVRH